MKTVLLLMIAGGCKGSNIYKEQISTTRQDELAMHSMHDDHITIPSDVS